MKNSKIIKIILPLLIILAFCTIATANYDPNGFPLEDNLVAHGKLHGGVYVSGGHGRPEKPIDIEPYTEQFEVPNGTIKFARLYTGGMLSASDGVGWINNNLIQLGIPKENSIIADISKYYYLIGMPVYFDNENLMHDVTTGNVYSTDGVLEACDNPFYNSSDTITYKDTGPSIWIASGVDTESAKSAANLLLTPEKLDKFWMLVVADLPDIMVSEISLPTNLFLNLSNQINAVILAMHPRLRII
ncbi:MAG: hypothetical protein ACE5KT_09460 [Methanosarcinales archaeon]